MVKAEHRGDKQQVWTLDGWSALADAALELIREARESVVILTTDMEPAVYDHEPLIEALQSWLTRARRTHLAVLVRDPRAAAQRGGRLLQLVQRLPSHAAIRRPLVDPNDPNDTFMVVDQRAYFHRPDPTRALGTASRNSVRRAVALGRRFEAAWVHALPDDNLRRLFL